jgi:DNA-directed RNA polymerase subunit RPC12/RpoP
MVIKVCSNCGKTVDTEKDLFVEVGTYEGDCIIEEKYYHMECWRRYFEDKTKDKAEYIVNHMQDKMQPIAKQLGDQFKKLIGGL